MNSVEYLSVPDFYQYERQLQPNDDMTYVISPECPCISDKKYNDEILKLITEMHMKQNKRTTRKNNKQCVKPILKIY